MAKCQSTNTADRDIFACNLHFPIVQIKNKLQFQNDGYCFYEYIIFC